MAVRSANLNVMFKAAEKAAKGLVRDFGELEQLQVSVKGVGDFVSAADLRAEKIIKHELMKARPSWGFLMEESGSQDGDGVHRWIVDPLDGTTNFLHGIPHFAISIALEVDGEITAAVIYNPVTDERFWAEKGGGAFFNDRRMRVSARRKIDEAVIATGIPHKGRQYHKAFLEQLPRVMANTAGVRRMGAASLDLAYTAAGRYDGFWEMGLSPWDSAAGILMVREAGGYVSALDGKDKNPIYTGNMLVSNEPLHYALLKMLQLPKAPASSAATNDTAGDGDA